MSILFKIKNLINYILKLILVIISNYGIKINNPFKISYFLILYFINMFKYKKKYKSSSLSYVKKFPVNMKSLIPIVTDISAQSGKASGVYFFQDIWAANKIFQERPKMHVDIGSRIDGFVSHLLVFMSVTVIDIRPLKSSHPNLTFVQSDATNLSEIKDNSIMSLSTLHATEHFGLGRYGDKIDPNAPFIFIKNLIRVLKPGGKLYFSVPIGEEKLIYNANRVFSPFTILKAFNKLKLLEFSAIEKKGKLINDARIENWIENKYCCGLFVFYKEKSKIYRK